VVHVTVLFMMLVCEENKVEKHWCSRKLFIYVSDLGKSLAYALFELPLCRLLLSCKISTFLCVLQLIAHVALQHILALLT
jgi:hypothetical protein